MTQSNPPSNPQSHPQPKPQVPLDVARYLRGAPPESSQFDFLLGDWDVTAQRFNEDGSLLLEYQAAWAACALNEGRMIMDDFKALAPAGQALSSFVTLRTYSEVNQRWELTGLAALQPAMNAQWYGAMTGGEMVLNAAGSGPDGKRVRTKIRFFEIEQQRFKWESHTSLDDGNTWHLTARLTAVRAIRRRDV
jgi:hypothetical protein